ncbi:hypothetical protein DENIS_3408 [Desulfonema ishimotonii]|uniref:Nickel/cobalt efflux system n=1 Tax=Desulfonema ishimotonii TaxID=45657 RepID=A0A401FZS1_9BACT|nr:hypothetical protein [Desulfonema ishimotonii]GBC62436.1 hypothetical protein DENIS_3408 [Desulfonema ishimotonii]
MKRICILCFLLICGGVLTQAAWGNPFMSKRKADNTPQAVEAEGTPPSPFLVKITRWQHQLNQKMSGMVREFRETGNVRPLVTLMLIAFGYGAIHAAGPGHGKAVTLSYILSRRGTVLNGIFFGNMVAFAHGLSGVVLVLTLRFVLDRRVMGTLEEVSGTTQIISYGLIALIGCVLLIKSLREWIRGGEMTSPPAASGRPGAQKGLVAMGLAVGLVPCPGVVLVMLFCLSQNMAGVGILLAVGVTLGMALTISAVTVIGLSGKNTAVSAATRYDNRMGIIAERIFETLSAVLVLAFGIIFLMATRIS